MTQSLVLLKPNLQARQLALRLWLLLGGKLHPAASSSKATLLMCGLKEMGLTH
jgi:hypothetical protein